MRKGASLEWQCIKPVINSLKTTDAAIFNRLAMLPVNCPSLSDYCKQTFHNNNVYTSVSHIEHLCLQRKAPRKHSLQ